MANILLVEDELNLLKLTEMRLKKAGHEVVGEMSGVSAIERIEAEGAKDMGLPFDVVVTDYCLKDATGLDVLHAVKRYDRSTQVLLVTAYATTQTAVEVMRGGAFDYIEKPCKFDELLALIDKANDRRIISRAESADHAVDNSALTNVIGESVAMKNVFDLISRVAPTKANILITGESGTGKEVIARAIHQLSGVQGPFVPVNCGAIPETLVESEFFGYAKGAFTGAIHNKVGYFQAAKGGTLFLDEIGELPMAMQVKLLRASQEKKIQPVGSITEIPVSVRIVAATNRDLNAEVEAHHFREDLFFRLNVFQILLPSLRERREDIPRLINHFHKKFNAELGKKIDDIEPDALAILTCHDYRGNVRELENILEHAATLESTNKITIESLPVYIRNQYANSLSKPKSSPLPEKKNLDDVSQIKAVEEAMNVKVDDGIELEGIVEELERKLIDQALEKTGGNKTEAAKLLGITFRSMRYRLKKYGIE
ncbi:MAG: sigma-54-dependent Fis family transcriptional regulator [Proteobacteria bacterium]|nr:sigma-54-dependent Fis family transcriptional regulator [Pseudomonadota bacterium]